MIFIVELQQLRKIEIRNLVTRIFERHRTVYKKCPKRMKIKELKKKTKKKTTETEPWNSVHMDHAYISGIRLLIILVEFFSGWPEIIRVCDRKRDDKMNFTNNILKVWGSENLSIKQCP